MESTTVIQRGVLLYIGNTFMAILGLVFWVIISIISGYETVGVTGTILNTSLIISNIVILGIPIGVQFHLGKAFKEKDHIKLNQFFWSSWLSIILLSLPASIVSLLFFTIRIDFLNINHEMWLIISILLMLNNYTIFFSFFASLLKTAHITGINLISSIIKVFLGILLALIGLSWFGVSLGIIMGYFVIWIMSLYYILSFFNKKEELKPKFSFITSISVISTSFYSWFPGMVLSLGQQLIILLIYSTWGSVETGNFYLIFSVFSLVSSLPTAIIGLMYPVLSGMENGKSIITSQIFNFMFALILPIVVFLLVYPRTVLNIINLNNSTNVATFQILIISIIPQIFFSLIWFFSYSQELYKEVFILSLLISITRIISYFLLVPLYGGIGASFSYTLGFVMGGVLGILASRKIEIIYTWSKILVQFGIVCVLIIIILIFDLVWIFGGLVILIVSYYVSFKLDMIKSSDIKKIIQQKGD